MTREPTGVDLSMRIDLSKTFAPLGFIFPETYLGMMREGELPDVSPVFWLLRLESGVQNWTRILAEQYPESVLVPFAKGGSSDDIYCFNGKDTSGNPPVILIHSFTEPGWEYRGEWFHFDSWYAGLVEFHEAWARGEDNGFEAPQPQAT